jgi:hypothetical protein
MGAVPRAALMQRQKKMKKRQKKENERSQQMLRVKFNLQSGLFHWDPRACSPRGRPLNCGEASDRVVHLNFTADFSLKFFFMGSSSGILRRGLKNCGTIK